MVREGLPDFHALLGREGCARACLYAFDLLLVGAEDLRGLTLVERRTLLRKYLRRAGAAITYTHDPTNNRPSNLKAFCQRCHMLHDRPEHQRRRWFTLFRRKALGDLYQGRYH